MRHRMIAFAFLIGTTATLAAQSNLSFEFYSDPYSLSNNGYTPAVVAGDFNNDGKPDLIQCCTSSGLMFREGNGDGTFQAPATAAALPDGNNVEDLVAVDVNGDGKLDLIGIPVAENTAEGAPTNTVAVWLGNGNGTFQAPQVYTLTNSAGNGLIPEIAVGNFFGDGHPDLAVGETRGNIDLFRNEGNGTFVFAKSITVDSGAQSNVVSLASGDLNGNGVSDLAAALISTTSNNYAGSAYVLWCDGKGDFTQDELGSYDYPLVAIGRVNGDGMMDVLVGYSDSPTQDNYAGIDVYYGQGDNQLAKQTAVAEPGVELFQLAGVDVNGDGYGDIVATGYAAGTGNESTLLVWLGNANGSFQQTAREFALGNESDEGPWTMADFNRDGMMDIVMDTSLDLNAEVMINSTTRAGCGTYTISPSVTVCQPVDNTYSPSPVTVDATSFDTTKVTAMQEYVDNQLVYSEPVSSFDTTFTEPVGSHFFVTKGWDDSGRNFVADRTVTVYDGTPGPVCPAAPQTANICLPSGTTSSSPVEILANGNTTTSQPTAAQLYIDGTLVVNNHGPYYSSIGYTEPASWVQTSQNLSAGTHTLVFKVWDLAGNVYQATKTITVN